MPDFQAKAVVTRNKESVKHTGMMTFCVLGTLPVVFALSEANCCKYLDKVGSCQICVKP